MRKFYRLNQNITAETVRLIDDKGHQIGVVSIQEAARKAREQSLDLVEIAREAKPPVVKIIDFKKFKYEEDKKERVAKKKTRQVDTKEVWLSPTIGEHDLETRLNRAKHFLQIGDRVKLTVKFTGRQMAHQDLGFKVIKRSLEKISDFGEKDTEPRMLGRNLSLNIKPISKVKKNETKD